MARLSSEKRAELESFWRSHHEAWERSTLNQREYCEAHGLPLKRFGNWRAKFKTETAVVQGKLLYRRGGSLKHMASHMSDKEIASASTGYVPSVKSMPEGRRNFRMADKKRIVAEAMAPVLRYRALPVVTGLTHGCCSGGSGNSPHHHPSRYSCR